MSLGLYMDEQVPYAITEGLRIRGIDVLTAQEDGRRQTADDALIGRATDLGRLLFSDDADMLRHATRRQRSHIEFSGVVYGHFAETTIGQCIADLELICVAGEPEEFANRVVHLPLR